jgi:hypothetical protein
MYYRFKFTLYVISSSNKSNCECIVYIYSTLISHVCGVSYRYLDYILDKRRDSDDCTQALIGLTDGIAYCILHISIITASIFYISIAHSISIII